MDFLPSDIAVTPLAKVLEVNDGRQRLAVSEPAQISRPLSIQSQNKGWSREQAPQVHFVQPSRTLSFKYWHIVTQGAIHSQHCLGQMCMEDHTAAEVHGCNTRPQMRPDMQ